MKLKQKVFSKTRLLFVVTSFCFTNTIELSWTVSTEQKFRPIWKRSQHDNTQGSNRRQVRNRALDRMEKDLKGEDNSCHDND